MCTFHIAWCQWSQPRAALTYMFVLTPRAAFERLGQQFRLECTWVATCQKVGPKQQLPHECSSSLWSQEIAISNICFNRHLRLCNRIYGTFSLSRIQVEHIGALTANLSCISSHMHQILVGTCAVCLVRGCDGHYDQYE